MALAILSDNLVTLSNLFDELTQTYVNDATVTGALSYGAQSVYTFNCSYVAGSNGVYRGAIPFAITGTLLPGNVYTILVTAASTSWQVALQQTQVAEILAG